MPLHGPTDRLARLIQKMGEMSGAGPEFIAGLRPTLAKLLSHATGTVPPRHVSAAQRKYAVSSYLQGLIDENTVVEATGTTLHVRLADDSVPHLRPLVPVGDLPLEWRGAIFQRLRGQVRRALGLQYAIEQVEGILSRGGPMKAGALRAEAERLGVKARALMPARRALGVVTRRGVLSLPGGSNGR